jgi:hypothetical protein
MLDEDLITEARKIVETASRKGVNLRVLGAVAFRLHCPNQSTLIKSMARHLSDLDFVGYSGDRDEIASVFGQCQYTWDPETFMEAAFSTGRLIFTKDGGSIHADVFLDRLEMSHTIDFRNRLELDYPTIPLAELALEKLQIHDLTEKDLKDLVVLLSEHDLGEGEKETIDIGYIARTLAADWGFYFSVTSNLSKLMHYVKNQKEETIPGENGRTVAERVGRMLSRIDNEPKSLAWRMRARIGTKRKWYSDVEDTLREVGS